MLDSVSSQQAFVYDDQAQGFDLAYLLTALKRRVFYFLIPFLIVALLGLAVTEFQVPIYRAEGKMLLESSGISSDLLHPTINELISERFEVYKERVLAPDNLIATMEKFDLFHGAREHMSGFQLLELMRKRVAITPVPLEMQPNRPTTAFSVSFDYEVPELALKVDDQFLNEILAQDTSRRTNNAVQTAQLLEDQVTKLKNEYDTAVAQLEAAKQRPLGQQQAASEGAQTQSKSLAALEAELAEKSSIYSYEHPVIKKLKKDIATFKQMIATAPQKISPAEKPDQNEGLLQVLTQREMLLEKNLDDAKNKLAMARLGESLEKNQQADHLAVIQYPELPGDPIKPKKIKWLAMVLALAVMAGAASIFGAELLDRSIRSKKELARFVDSHLIVSVPYLPKPGEQLRRRAKLVLIYMALVLVTGATITFILVTKPDPVNLARLIPLPR